MNRQTRLGWHVLIHTNYTSLVVVVDVFAHGLEHAAATIAVCVATTAAATASI